MSFRQLALKSFVLKPSSVSLGLKSKFTLLDRKLIPNPRPIGWNFQIKDHILDTKREGFIGVWSFDYNQTGFLSNTTEVAALAVIGKRPTSEVEHYFEWFHIEPQFRKMGLCPFFVHEFLLNVAERDPKPIRVWAIPSTVKLACYTMDAYNWSSTRENHFVILRPPNKSIV